MTPQAFTEIEGRKIPTAWRIAIPRLGLAIDCTPLAIETVPGSNGSTCGPAAIALIGVFDTR